MSNMTVEVWKDDGEGRNRIQVSGEDGFHCGDTGERDNQVEDYACTLKNLYFAIERIAELESGPKAASTQAPQMSRMAQKKIDQMGGTICGVLVQNEAGAYAAVDEHGRVMWLDGWGEAARAQGDDWLIQLRGDYLITRGIWERADHRGYTNDISEAGRYSEAEARKAEQDSPEKYKAVRLPTTRAQGDSESERQCSHCGGYANWCDDCGYDTKPEGSEGDAQPVALLCREIGESTWFDHCPLRPGSAEAQSVIGSPILDYCEVYARPPSAGVPEGWSIAPANHFKKAAGIEADGFLIQSPRVNGVTENTAVWADSGDLAGRLLYLMLASAPQPPVAGVPEWVKCCDRQPTEDDADHEGLVWVSDGNEPWAACFEHVHALEGHYWLPAGTDSSPKPPNLDMRVPAILYDGFTVFQEVQSERESKGLKKIHDATAVSDVLDAVVRLIKQEGA